MNFYKNISILVALITVGALFAAPLQFGHSGEMTWQGLTFQLQANYGNWNSAKFVEQNHKITGNTAVSNYQVRYGKKFGTAQIRVTTYSAQKMRVQVEIPAAPDVKMGLRYVELQLPCNQAQSYTVSRQKQNKTLAFPAQLGKSGLLKFNSSTSGIITLSNGKQIQHEGRSTIYVQDNRKFKRNYFVIRFWLRDGELDLTFTQGKFAVPAVAKSTPAQVKLDANLKLTPTNVFTWHDTKFEVTSTYGNWRHAKFYSDRRENLPTGAVKNFYTTKFRGETGKAEVTFRTPDSNTLELTAHCPYPNGVQRGLRYVSLNFPAAEATKLLLTNAQRTKVIKFTPKFVKSALGQLNEVKSGSLVLTDGRVIDFEFHGTVYAQDNRCYSKNGRRRTDCTIRFWFTDDNFQAKFYWKGLKIRPVALLGYANRFFRDDYANDLKGGWTDQGASNDLRMLQPGLHRYRNMTFDVSDEKTTAQPGAIIVAGSHRKFAPTEVVLPLPGDFNAKSILLLHAAAWTGNGKLGEIEISYADTSKQIIDIVAQKDVADWWSPRDQVNAKVAWQSSNSERKVGLYASSFNLTGVKPVQAVFRGTSRAAWMIAAVSLGNAPITLPQHIAQPLVTRADKNWLKLDFQRRTVPGSVLDFSWLPQKDAPAGKYGRVIVSPRGTLTFEKAPDKTLRLYGVNLCESGNFIPKQHAAELADFIAAQGCNSVRFHHHDRYLRHRSNPTPGVLDPENLDRLDFLAAKLIERGIYLTFDFFTSRRLIKGETLDVMKKYPGMTLKFALGFTPEGHENFKAFAKSWMTHRNPYTGRTWGEEPAVAFANLINEDVWSYSFLNNRAQVKYLGEAFQKYCAQHPVKDKSVHLGNPEFYGFMLKMQRDGALKLAKFLREELGVKFPLTSANFNGNLATTWLRDSFDLVDDHMYKDHPTFPGRPWSHPHAFSQTSTIPAEAYLPVSIIRGRIFDKPFVMTEFNFCAPNIYRSEGGAILGAYGAMHNCTGFYRFCFTHNRNRYLEHKWGPVCFESVADPIMQLSDRLSAVYFLRGDVKIAPEKYADTLPRDFWNQKRNIGYANLRQLGLFAQTGIQLSDRPVAGVKNYLNLANPQLQKRLKTYQQTGVAHSLTDEIELDARRTTFKVMTPKSESISGGKGVIKGKILQVAQLDVFQTVAAIALDDAKLTDSRKILILQMTNVCGSGEKYTDVDRRVQEHIGREPLLLRRSKIAVTLDVDAKFKVAAINMQGEVVGEIPGQLRNGKFSFKADNGAFKGGVVAYCLTR